MQKQVDEVIHDLQRCGLRPCENGANAHNPQFSRSQSEWEAAARGWIRDPTSGLLRHAFRKGN